MKFTVNKNIPKWRELNVSRMKNLIYNCIYIGHFFRSNFHFPQLAQKKPNRKNCLGSREAASKVSCLARFNALRRNHLSRNQIKATDRRTHTEKKKRNGDKLCWPRYKSTEIRQIFGSKLRSLFSWHLIKGTDTGTQNYM